MQAGTGAATFLGQDVENPELVVLTQSLTEVLSEAAEEGCEPNEDYLNSYPNDGNVYDDTEFYGSSGEEKESDYNDGNDEDEETASDDTQAYDYSHENDEAVEYEGQDETSWTINKEDEAIQHPIAGFRNSSGHDAYESGENKQASRKLGLEISDDYWSTPAFGLERSYEYTEFFLSCPSKVRYALLRHLINECETSFHRFVHYHFGEYLKSEKWRQEILTDDGVGRLASLPWDRLHAVEVKDWIKLMERVRDARLLPKDAFADPDTFSPQTLTPAFQILRMAEYIRNRTFHREEPVILSQLRTALQIPRVLKDGKKSDELEAMYAVIVNDPELDAPSSQWVCNILFPPQPESGTCPRSTLKYSAFLKKGCSTLRKGKIVGCWLRNSGPSLNMVRCRYMRITGRTPG